MVITLELAIGLIINIFKLVHFILDVLLWMEWDKGCSLQVHSFKHLLGGFILITVLVRTTPLMLQLQLLLIIWLLIIVLVPLLLLVIIIVGSILVLVLILLLLR